jgi:hypothetical protein
MSTEDCWVCGGTTTPKYRKVLNSESNSHLLESLRRIGATNLPRSLPTLPAAGTERTYVCRACAVETERWCTLEKNFKVVSESIKSKLQSRGLLEETSTDAHVSELDQISTHNNTTVHVIN